MILIEFINKWFFDLFSLISSVGEENEIFSGFIFTFLRVRNCRLLSSTVHASLEVKNKRGRKSIDYQPLILSRDYWTRTSDLAPPRRVRYQLR